MAAALDLRYILLEILPSPVLEAKAQELRIQNHLEMIHGRLWALNAVIVDALVRALEEPEVEEWVRDVEMVNADVEDMLRGIMGWQPRAAAASNRLPRSFLGVGAAHSRRRTILLELVEKTRRLNYLVRRESSLGLRKEMMNSVDPRGEEEEYSTVLREEVVGRDTDVDEIIKILQRQQKDYRDHAVFLVAIYGNPMVGTTTVARMVFHHPWVRGHFHRRIWIDVPSLSSFDPVWIAKEFARSIAGEPCEDVWLFCDRFGGGFGRYLLVLDDIHIDEEDKIKWYQLEHFLFLGGGRGSTVIFTGELCYNEYVYHFSIDEYTYNWERHRLSKLWNEDWTKLFVKHATSSHPDDDQVEASMVRPLTGLIYTGTPADAKMLGSLFRYTETSWLLEEQLRHVKMDDHRIHLMFLHYIPPRLARFNLYRWLMPQDHVSDHGDLLYMLAAEGLSEGLQEYRLESQRHNAFYESIGNVIERCRFTMRVGQDSTFPRQCLHVHLLVESQTCAFPAVLSKKENKLRTLVLRREEEMILKQRPCGITSIPAAMFANLTHLRILYLGATSIRQLPRTIGMLLNLRLLNLSSAHVQALPASLCNLRQLQILNVAWCEKLRKLPGRIHNLQSLQFLKLAFCASLRRLPKSTTGLVNLRELDLEGCHGLLELPEGFSNLTKLANLKMIKCGSLTRMSDRIRQMSNLRKLSGYVATGSYRYIISELLALSNLEELHLQNLESVSNQEDSTAPAPSKVQDTLRKLKCLSLHWQWWKTDDTEAASEAISLQLLENLQPDICLRKLGITCYAGKEFPGWIGEGVRYFRNLNAIKLVNLRRCETLPPLGQLRNLKIIEISGMDLVTVVDDAFYGDSYFEMLEKLIFSEMPRLEEWLKPTVVSYRHRYMFSIRLRELTLIQCPKLRKLEPHLFVERLNNEMLWTSEFLDWNHIHVDYGELMLVGCQELRCLPQEMQYLGHLERLTVIRCNELVSLPDWLPKSRSLKTVIISSCVEMSSIPEGVEQLRGLTVNGCPKLRL